MRKEYTDDEFFQKKILSSAFQIHGLEKIESIIEYFYGEYKIVKLVEFWRWHLC